VRRGDGSLCEKHIALFHPPTYDQISVVFRDKGHQLPAISVMLPFMAAELVILGVITQADGSSDSIYIRKVVK
jgi:hypothetical protein